MGKFDSVNMLYSTHEILKFNNVHKYFLLLCMFRNLTVRLTVSYSPWLQVHTQQEVFV